MVSLAVGIGCVVGILVIAAGLIWAWYWTTQPRRGRRVVVSLYGTHDEGDIIGVLWERRGRWLLLREASVLQPGSTVPQPIDGEAMVDMTRVRYLQVLP